MKKITVLGSTGSIGTQTLDIARDNGYIVKALAANTNVKLLENQAREFHPEAICIGNEDKYNQLKSSVADLNCKVVCGIDGLCEIAAMNDCDTMVNSLVGMVGLLPTLVAIDNKTDIALANKETLVAGGELVIKNAKKNNVKIYPVDSEHSAIFQCLQGNQSNAISKIILTASGGPFFSKTKSQLADVTIEQALNHPNWSMGNKITIDSATLMNKGLEFIEAKWLFDLQPSQIEIVVHRQSVVHSAVEFEDNSVIAQLGVPDMKIPIQYALTYPERKPCSVKKLSLTDYGTLTFEKPDYETFDCLSSCIKAIEMGGAYPCVVNAVNEEAVAMFLNGKISFLRIGELSKLALEKFEYMDANSYEDIKSAENMARLFARETA